MNRRKIFIEVEVEDDPQLVANVGRFIRENHLPPIIHDGILDTILAGQVYIAMMTGKAAIHDK